MPDPPKTPPDLGSLKELRKVLEASLRLRPAPAEPPELLRLLRLPLPPHRKLALIPGTQILRENLAWDPHGPPRGLASLRRALHILEKYARNLLGPRRPPHWREVRFGNPVYRSALAHIQGGRAVLKLLGYTQESGEGLSFPAPPTEPRPQLVAAVTADVMLLRAELELLELNQHPNPHFFSQILLGEEECPLVSDALPAPSEEPPAGAAGDFWECRSCTFRNPSPHVLCQACERPRLARRPAESPSPPQAWPCPRCTFLNPGPAPRCDVCGSDPAHAADIITGTATPTPGENPVTSGSENATSGCGPAPSGEAAIASGCGSAHSDADQCTSGSGSASSGVVATTSGCGSAFSGVDRGASGLGPAPSRDALRQRKLLEDGRRLVELVRAAQSQGLPPESLGPSPLSEIPEASDADSRIRRFRSRLGPALKALQEAEPDPEVGGASLGGFSLVEAAWAWLEGEGQPERARRALIGRRKQQLALLSRLGFPEVSAAAPALRRHGGDQWEALKELQRGKLRPFLLRHFRGEEPGLDFNQADQQALLRQILATLPVASWGRAWLVAGLGRELGLGRSDSPSLDPLLVELVEAVGACPDRAALRRRLRCECALCGWGLPRQLMQWLPGCSCPLCPECFRLHFTVGLRERGVGALGCPSCGRPDLRDEAQRLCYWSTLEPALRRCLDPDTFGLVTRKLAELELLRDPQFLWCPHCSFGFIFEAERGPARCPQCQQSCCPRCQLPWQPQHGSMSCSQFRAWIRSREPPPTGLGAFLGDPGVECPRCGQRFALARGGCLHFQCSQCRHHFCSGCGAQFHQPGSCPSPQCPLGGSLHGHHPRDCLFYLRDWAPPRLQQLLRAGNVEFETEPPPEAPPNPTGRCPVPEQKALGAAFRDEPCGKETEPGHAGLCRSHYTEYLVSLINRHGLDPAPFYQGAELEAAAQRHLPAGSGRGLPGESPAHREQRLRRLLATEAPVRPRPPAPGPRPLC